MFAISNIFQSFKWHTRNNYSVKFYRFHWNDDVARLLFPLSSWEAHCSALLSLVRDIKLLLSATSNVALVFNIKLLWSATSNHSCPLYQIALVPTSKSVLSATSTSLLSATSKVALLRNITSGKSNFALVCDIKSLLSATSKVALA
jgi:hypothetical protein